MTHGSVAKKVREYKEKHPEQYCSVPGCLWRIRTAAENSDNPCRKHPQTATATPVKDVTVDTADQQVRAPLTV